MLNGVKATKELLNALDSVKKPQTNADRIRSMSDEGLAAFFRMFCIGMADCRDCPLYISGCPMSSTFNDWMKWLQQPAEPPKEE